MPPANKKPRRKNSDTDSNESVGSGFFSLAAKIVQKAGPITKQELAIILLLATLFVGAIVCLALDDKLNALGVGALIFIFTVAAAFVFIYTFLPKRGFQSIRQVELREEVRELRMDHFEKSLPKFSQN